MKRVTLSIAAGALCIALAACGNDGQQAAELRALSGASEAAAPSPPAQIVAPLPTRASSPTPPTAAPTWTPQPTPEPQVIPVPVPVEVTRIVEVVSVATPTPQAQPAQAQPPALARGDIPAIEPCYVDGRKLKAADGSPCPWRP